MRLRGAALGALARRDHASSELAAKLIAKGHDPEAVAALVAELRAEGSLDDRRHAESFVRQHAARGHGPVRIRQELRQAGLSSELIEAALAQGVDWGNLAADVRRRKFGTEVPGDWAEKARQARFLQYRGFSTDHIRLALGRDFDP